MATRQGTELSSEGKPLILWSDTVDRQLCWCGAGGGLSGRGRGRAVQLVLLAVLHPVTPERSGEAAAAGGTEPLCRAALAAGAAAGGGEGGVLRGGAGGAARGGAAGPAPSLALAHLAARAPPPLAGPVLQTPGMAGTAVGGQAGRPGPHQAWLALAAGVGRVGRQPRAQLASRGRGRLLALIIANLSRLSWTALPLLLPVFLRSSPSFLSPSNALKTWAAKNSQAQSHGSVPSAE